MSPFLVLLKQAKTDLKQRKPKHNDPLLFKIILLML